MFTYSNVLAMIKTIQIRKQRSVPIESLL